MKLNLKKKIKEKFTYLYCDLRNDHNFDLVKLSEINPKNILSYLKVPQGVINLTEVLYCSFRRKLYWLKKKMINTTSLIN